ncbi:AraC family transcriptional regulator [Cohnella fermenti]|uniref:Helix-turn-helix transcriptional regulator n=1 Tax=Cohnella fermenti TaxID=2565925 RepID=A0A4S4BUF7_9BACL|nr:AraC family transcriptional regulator [Cohnella fermenti]THF78737.1 helix-turn-helix transcriptional regulator [Cohnella fermenti]
MGSLTIHEVESVVAGSVVYPPGGRFGPRIQNDIQLVMLHSGTVEIMIDDLRLTVRSGHMIKLMPGREETFRFASSEETWHRWVAVHPRDLSEEAFRYFDELPTVLALSEEMNRLTDLILSLQLRLSDDDPLLRSLGFSALQLFPIESSRHTWEKEKHSAVYRAIEWVRVHYAEDIALGDIAKACGVSAEHLIRLFKQHEKRTPIQFLWDHRLDRAISLLIHTGLAITEIADRCGFKSSNHFARLVKQSTGLTASQIRQSSWRGLRASSRERR